MSDSRKRIHVCLPVLGLLAACLLPAVSCSRNDEATPRQKETLSVFVNIPPQAAFVEQIGGEFVDVNVLIPPGRDPHVFTPTQRQIRELAASDIYFHGIMPFGQELARRVAGLDTGTRIVDITEGVELRRIEEHHHHHDHDNGHNHAGDHRHHRHDGEGMDPHVWLSPPEIAVQARNIAGVLKDADPERAEKYDENLNAFLDRVEDVHRRLKEDLAPYRGRTFYVYHPAFGYFARAYGLEQRAVETGGTSPTMRQLQELIQQAREENVRVIFVQPQFAVQSAEIVADAIDGVVVQLDPLAEDVLDNLLEMGEQIGKALGTGNE